MPNELAGGLYVGSDSLRRADREKRLSHALHVNRFVRRGPVSYIVV